MLGTIIAFVCLVILFAIVLAVMLKVLSSMSAKIGTAL